MRDEDDDLLRAAEELGIDLSGVRAVAGDASDEELDGEDATDAAAGEPTARRTSRRRTRSPIEDGSRIDVEDVEPSRAWPTRRLRRVVPESTTTQAMPAGLRPSHDLSVNPQLEGHHR